MDIFRNILIGCVAVILSAAVVCGGVYVVYNGPALLSQSKLYTEKELDNAYSNGYIDGRDGYPELVKQVDDLLTENAAMQIQIDELEADIEQKQSDLDETVRALLDSELSAESKQQLIDELNENIYELSQYVNELNDMIIALQNENYFLRQQVAVLEEQKASLLQTVYAYEQLIESLQDEIISQRFVVTFMFDDTVYSLVLVPVDGVITILNPDENDEFVYDREYTIFLGWSLEQDGELIDLTTFTPTMDTVIYAKLIRKYRVTFVYEQEVYTERIVLKGNTVPTAAAGTILPPEDLVTVVSPNNTDRKIFFGWSLNGVDIINPAIHQIGEHTTYFSVVETRYNVRFVIPTKTTLQSTYNGPTATLTAPTPPVYDGYTFNGWYLNGVKVTNFTNYNVISDLIFYAKYTSNTQTVSGFPLTIHDDTLTVSGLEYSLSNYLPTANYGSITISITVYDKYDNKSYNHTLTLNSTVITKQYSSYNEFGYFTYYFYNIEFLYVAGLGSYSNFKLKLSSYTSPNTNGLGHYENYDQLTVTINSIRFVYPDTIKP
jgi:uncharacterized repeat protein (TIGR02543 family)